MEFHANGNNGGANGADSLADTGNGTGLSAHDLGADSRVQLAQDAAGTAFAGTGRRVIAQPDQQNTVMLPAGTSLSNLEVDGENLIVTLPDGSRMVIIDAVIYDVDLVIQGTTIPDENWKDFLGVDEQLDPEAGNPRSSGGNFDDPVLPIDPAYGLGDLLPYTELQFPTQENVEVGQYQLQPNRVPDITDIPAIAENDAGTFVDEDGLPARDGDQGSEPAGTMDETNDETTVGTITFTSPDGVDQILIDGVPVFDIVDGEIVITYPPTPLGPGVLTIVDVDIDNGTITYDYTLTDNTTGDNNTVDFDVTVIDPQGDSDTGNVVVRIIDDVPIATDDGNLATLPDEASNVIVGTVEQIVSNDDYGADGVGDPAITIGSGDQGGTITIVDGNLVYTPAIDVQPGQDVVETFTYTITDGDGSVSNEATFTITLTEGGPSIAADAATIAVDEDGLPGGIAGGDGDIAGEATTGSGLLAGLDFGPDGAGDIALQPSADTGLVSKDGNPIETVWDATSHTLTGQDAVTGDAVFTLVITDTATGAYEFTLLAPVTHPGAGEDDVTLSIPVIVTDADGDSVTGNIALSINDDSPVMELTGVEVGVAVLDESPLAADGVNTASIDFSGSFAASFGADGAGDVTYALALAGSDVGSGIFTLGGTEIVLNIADGVITGSADGTDYFTIRVDAAGEVTFAFTGDYANVSHGDTTSADDMVALIAEAGAITLTGTATDADGDMASAAIDLGTGIFMIEDDGPALNASATGEAGHIAITSDADITDSATIDLSAIFSANEDYGTDGPGALDTVYGLALNGTDTGLTSGGQPITLTIDGNTVTGATASGTVFTVTVDAETGLLTLTQSAAIDHADGSDLATLANGLIEATYSATVTDADGDTATGSANIDLGGNLQFADDGIGIVVSQDAVRALLDESPLSADGIDSVTIGFANRFAVSPGNDGLASTSFELSLDGSDVGSGIYTLGGTEIVLNLSGNTITGSADGIDYFTITLDPSAVEITFAFTDDYANVRHPDATDSDDGVALLTDSGLFSLIATATDFDGDTATASLDLGAGIFVIQDDGPTAVDDGAFMVNEDQATIVDVFANDDAGTDGVDPATGIALETGPAKGSVSYNGDGTFTYTPDAGASGDDSFTYTITDADGDSSTATVTLTIGADSAPVIRSVADVTVDEDGLPGSNSDDGQTDPAETASTGLTTATGTIVVAYGPDVPADPLAAFEFTNVDALDGSITSDGQPVDFALDASGNIVGTVDGGPTTVITVALTDASVPVNGDITYSYTVTLLQPVDHPTAGSEDTVTIPGISFTVTDSDGSTASGSFDADITDDVPSVETVLDGAPVLVVDDTTLGTDASADFSAAFNFVAGADGAAGTNYVLGVSAPGADSGLVDTATGDAILLYVEGDAVVGRVGGDAGAIAFTVTVDAAGTVTLDQTRAIQHDDPADAVEAAPDAAQTLASADLITLTASITDGDGDTASDTLNIGQMLLFEDDGPAITADAASDIGLAQTSDAALPDSDATGLNLATVFGYSGADYGADGAGSIVESFGFSLLIAEGADSGLTSGGAAIRLYVSDDGLTVTGSTAGSEGAVDGTNTVFTISVATNGAVTLSQSLAIDHAPGSDLLTLSDGLIQADYAVTITDGDGDSATQTSSIDLGGNIAFGDDLPTIEATGDALAATLDESPVAPDGDGIVSVSVDYSSSFTGDYGADGAGSITYALTLDGSDVASGLYALNASGTGAGDEIVLNLVGGEIVGTAGGQTYFTISVSADGMVNFSQTANVWHGNTGSDDDAVSILLADGTMGLTATITDSDDDSASASIDLSGGVFSIDDDGPSVTVSAIADEDSEQAATDDDGSPSIDTLQLSAIFAASDIDYGTDGPAPANAMTASYALAIAGGYDAGSGSGLTSGGAAIYLYQLGDTIIASTSAVEGDVEPANTVFTVAADPASGEATLQQFAPIDHAPGSDAISLPTDLIEASYSVSITDGDGDTASDSASVDLGGNLVFNDDTPAVEVTGDIAPALLDESPLSPDGDGINSVTVDYSANFAFTNSADGPNTVSYALNLAADGIGSGLYALDDSDVTDADGDGIGQGDEILLTMDGGDVVGMANGIEYFRIALDEATGEVTFSRSDNIWHAVTGFYADDDAQTITLPADMLQLTATITDGDTDSATASIDLGQDVFTIEDDGPSVGLVTKYANLSMSGTADYALVAEGHLEFDFGTDGPLGGSLGTGVEFAIKSSSSVDGMALTSIDQPTYDPADGLWHFSFDYVTQTGETGTNSGTISYDGSNYQLTLQDSFEFTSVVPFSTAVSRTAYEVPGVSQGQSEIIVSELDTGMGDPIWVQFTGFNGALSAGGDNTLDAGDVVGGDQTWISISNSENGVAGDTIQDGEVLDFDFFNGNPYQYNWETSAYVTGMTFTLDGVGANEDFIVILKLADPDNLGNVITTRAIVVGSDDIYRNSDTIPDGYGAPALDNNDGFVIIEPNDYLQGNEGYVIVGAQLMASSSDLVGSGIDLNRAVGDDGGSSGTVAFGSETNDNDVVKISDIGLIRTIIDEQTVSLDIDITVTDADGDTEYTTFHINPFGDPIVLDMDGDGFNFQSLDNGVMYDMNGDGVVDATAWIGAGDAILVRDANGNGIVDDASEFIFHQDGMTDLQTLNALYGDVLDANDADFGMFGIWMDNGDGIFQDGEFLTLAEAGITDISLVSDGTTTTAIDGEVQIMGTGSFNGGTGTLVDAAFRFELGSQPDTAANTQRTQEMATIAAIAPALMVSTAAHAEGFFFADRMVNFDETGRSQIFNTDFQPFQPEAHVQPMAQVTLGAAQPAQMAALPETHAFTDGDFAGDTGLAQAGDVAGAEVPDLGASSETAASFDAGHGVDASAQMIEALLQLSAPPAEAGEQGEQSLGAVREALAEVTGNDAISNLVQQIIDSSGVEDQGASAHAVAPHGEQGAGHPVADASDLAALLHGQIAGAGHGGMSASVDHGDEAALMAAAAQ